MRVLLVEDDAALRDSLLRSLGMEGWASEVAASVEEAIRKVCEQDFDLIVTDYNLGPGRNGLVLLSHLNRERHGIPMILMSGCAEETLARTARGLGVFDFLVKPFPIDTFLEVCWRAVGAKAMKRRVG
jgi:DNA-binding NtrC family response regulator